MNNKKASNNENTIYEKFKTNAGYIAAVITSIAFIPTAYNTYKTKNADGLVLKTLLLFFTGQILWLIDGSIHSDKGLIIASIVNIITYFYLIYAKLLY